MKKKNAIILQELIDKKLQLILDSDNERNYILALILLNTGIFYEDLRKLTVGQIKKNNFKIKIKNKKINLNSIKNDIKEFIKNKQDHEYLFKSREGINKSIRREQAWAILKKYDLTPILLRKTYEMRIIYKDMFKKVKIEREKLEEDKQK